jgi:hypothetical protein
VVCWCPSDTELYIRTIRPSGYIMPQCTNACKAWERGFSGERLRKARHLPACSFEKPCLKVPQSQYLSDLAFGWGRPSACGGLSGRQTRASARLFHTPLWPQAMSNSQTEQMQGRLHIKELLGETNGMKPPEIGYSGEITQTSCQGWRNTQRLGFSLENCRVEPGAVPTAVPWSDRRARAVVKKTVEQR